MEFHVRLHQPAPPLEHIESLLLELDPAALIDIDPLNPLLRVATLVEAPELRLLLQRAGMTVSAQDIHQLPSICCGGCSG